METPVFTEVGDQTGCRIIVGCKTHDEALNLVAFGEAQRIADGGLSQVIVYSQGYVVQDRRRQRSQPLLLPGGEQKFRSHSRDGAIQVSRCFWLGSCSENSLMTFYINRRPLLPQPIEMPLARFIG